MFDMKKKTDWDRTELKKYHYNKESLVFPVQKPSIPCPKARSGHGDCIYVSEAMFTKENSCNGGNRWRGQDISDIKK